MGNSVVFWGDLRKLSFALNRFIKHIFYLRLTYRGILNEPEFSRAILLIAAFSLCRLIPVRRQLQFFLLYD